MEPEVRAHEPGAVTALMLQLQQLDSILQGKRIQLESDFEVEASQLRTKMHILIQAATAQPNIFKGESNMTRIHAGAFKLPAANSTTSFN